MNVEATILSLMWIIGISSIVLLIPKDRFRKSLFALLTFQAFIWISALLHVKFGLISFPIREFPKAVDVLFSAEYFFFPFIYAMYFIFEPVVGFLGRFCYLIFWISGLTLIHVLIERYSDLLNYENYTWYWAWLNFFVVFLLSNLVCKWFFKDKSLFGFRSVGT
jgi:hypothetical protein